MNTKFLCFLLFVLCCTFNCSVERKISGPDAPHGDANFPPLLVLTDSTQLHVPGNDTIPPPDFSPYEKEPAVLQKVNPVYPPEALDEGIQADVWIKAWVNKNGHVTQVHVFKSTDDLFNNASAAAGLPWLFAPGQLAGRPISVWVSIPFRFRIPSRNAL